MLLGALKVLTPSGTCYFLKAWVSAWIPIAQEILILNFCFIRLPQKYISSIDQWFYFKLIRLIFFSTEQDEPDDRELGGEENRSTGEETGPGAMLVLFDDFADITIRESLTRQMFQFTINII